MKKIVIILFLLPIMCNSQINNDKLNHFSVCAVNSAIIKGISWKLISDNTNWNLNTCHWVSDGLAIGSSILLGHLKEKHDQRNDGFYSKKDMLFNGIGAVVGTYTIRVIIGKAIPINRVPIKDVFDMENDPLIAEKY
jgi:hypothetical protein